MILDLDGFKIELPDDTTKATIVQPAGNGRLQHWSYRKGHYLARLGRPCDGIAFVTKAGGEETVVARVDDWPEAK